GNPRSVGTDTNLKHFFGLAISILHRLLSIAYLRIGNYFTLLVSAIEEPKFRFREQFKNALVQRFEVGALCIGLTGDVGFDLFLRIHCVRVNAVANRHSPCPGGQYFATTLNSVSCRALTNLTLYTDPTSRTGCQIQSRFA